MFTHAAKAEQCFLYTQDKKNTLFISNYLVDAQWCQFGLTDPFRESDIVNCLYFHLNSHSRKDLIEANGPTAILYAQPTQL